MARSILLVEGDEFEFDDENTVSDLVVKTAIIAADESGVPLTDPVESEDDENENEEDEDATLYFILNRNRSYTADEVITLLTSTQ